MTCGRGNKVPNPKSVPNQRQLRSAAPNAPKRRVWRAQALLVDLSKDDDGDEDDRPNSEDGKGDAPAPLQMEKTIMSSTDMIPGVGGAMSEEVILDTENKTKSVEKGKKKRRRRQKLFTLDQIARM